MRGAASGSSQQSRRRPRLQILIAHGGQIADQAAVLRPNEARRGYSGHLATRLLSANAPNPAGPNSVERALQMWSTRTPDEEHVIQALRHALAHDFALSNQNQKSTEYQHRFLLDRDPTRLVGLPSKPWSDDYASEEDDTTIVSLRALGDVVERVVGSVVSAAARSNVEITLAGGPDELVRRYGILHGA